MQRLLRTLILALSLIAASACTRLADKDSLADAVVISPAMQDVSLSLKSAEKLAFGLNPVRMNQTTMSSANYFRLVDDLKTLGRLQGDDALIGLAGKLHAGFYANEGNYLKTSFLEGPVPNAIAGQAGGPIRETVDALILEIRTALLSMKALLSESARGFPWPKELPQFTPALKITDQYASFLLNGVRSGNISPRMKAVAEDALNSRYATLRPMLAEFAAGLDQSQTMAEALAATLRGIEKLGIELDPASKQKFQRAEDLVNTLKSVESPQDTLSLLVKVWRITDPADRGNFKEVSPDLYNFFEGKSEDELDCLAKPHCFNPVLGIAKAIIFKKLEEYGLRKLKDQVDKAGRDGILNSVRGEALMAFPMVPTLIQKAMFAEAQKYLVLLGKVKANPTGFVKSHIQSWAQANFNQPLKGMETTSVKVTLKSREEILVSPERQYKEAVLSGAEVLGSSLSLAQEFLPMGDERQLQAAVVEPIMKLLAVGGFRMENGRGFPSLMLPINGQRSQIFQLENLMKDPVTYAVPDAFLANKQFLMDRRNAQANVNASAQAELLKGIARQIRFFRDWEQNAYDISLGKILIEDLLPEVPKGTVPTPFLPKDILFSLAVGNAGALLQNLILDLSPAFIVLDKGEVLWGNKYKEIKGNKISTLAGIVSIVNGRRSEVVRTVDVARFILALEEFMAASEGMEKSGSSLLQQKTDEGKSTLMADLLDIRKKLQLLQMGLCNYLVTIAMQPDGSLSSVAKVGGHLEKLNRPRRLEDQALAIRALLASSKRLDLPLLRWAALDIYYGMNRNFFREARQFYSGEVFANGSELRGATANEIVLALLAGEELSETMPLDVRAQWNSLSKPWIRSLQDF